MGTINTVPVTFKHEDNLQLPQNQASYLPLQAIRLSQASLELSSSRRVFGSLENERKRREKREKQTLTESCGRYLHKIKVSKRMLRVTKWGGGGGGGGGGLYRPPNV